MKHVLGLIIEASTHCTVQDERPKVLSIRVLLLLIPVSSRVICATSPAPPQLLHDTLDVVSLAPYRAPNTNNTNR